MLPPFATLLNEKRIIVSSKSTLMAIERHLLEQILVPTLAQIHVDDEWYRTRYPDIGDAIARNVVTDGKDHYVRFGYYEHRMPYFIQVDEPWYLDQYPDVREAVRREELPSAQAHFEGSGFAEGRFPFPNFSFKADKDAAPPKRSSR